MHLNKAAKIVLGILTFLPLVFGVSSLGIGIYHIFSLFFAEEPAMPLLLFSYLGYIIPYVFLFLIIYLALGIFYLVHILQNPFLDREKRGLWCIVLLILNGLAMPFYWYLHVWKEHITNDVTDTLETDYESGTKSDQF